MPRWPLSCAIVVSLLGVLCLAACQRESVQTKFEPLYRAAKTTQAATGVGVTYQRMGELLQTLAAEIAIAADKTETPEEGTIVSAYLEALATYKDSLSLWHAQIESYSTVTPELEPLIAKYKLKVTELTDGGRPLGISHFDPGSIQQVWEVGSKQVDKATRLYYHKSAGR